MNSGLDILLNASSAASLLSQTGATASGTDATLGGGLFSTLVGNDLGGDTPATLAPATAVWDQAAQAAIPATTTAATDNALDAATQDLKDLMDLLRKVINVLIQSYSGSSSNDAQASTADGSQAANTATTISSTTDLTKIDLSAILKAVNSSEKTNAMTLLQKLTDLSGNSDATAAGDDKTLTDIIAEILVLMQLIVQTLLQMQAAKGGEALQQTSGVQTISNTQAASATGTADATASASTNTDAAQTQNTDTASAQTGAGALVKVAEQVVQDASKFVKAVQKAAEKEVAADGSEQPVIELIKVAEKEAKALLDVLAASSASDATANNSDVTTQIADLKAAIETVISGLQQQAAAAASASQTDTSTSDEGTASISTAAQTLPITVPPLTIKPAAVKAELSEKAGKAKSTAKETQSNTESEASKDATKTAVAAQATANTGTQTANTKTGDRLADQIASCAHLSLVGLDQGNADDDGLRTEGGHAAGTYSFASTLSAFRAANGGAMGLPPVVDQVLLQMNRNVKNGQSQMTLQLQPSDLGKISVKLDVGSDGKVQGSVVADNPQTLSLLQKDSRSLERALQDAGLRADPGSLQFSLGGQKDQGAGQASGGGGGNAGTNDSDGTISAGDSGDGLVDLAAIPETYYVTPMGVNIEV